MCDCYGSDGDDAEVDLGPEMFIPFPVERGGEKRESGDGWGLVGGLEEGEEYEFSVVAVVMVGEVSMSGERSEPVRVTTYRTDGKSWGSGDFFVNIVLKLNSLHVYRQWRYQCCDHHIGNSGDTSGHLDGGWSCDPLHRMLPCQVHHTSPYIVSPDSKSTVGFACITRHLASFPD